MNFVTELMVHSVLFGPSTNAPYSSSASFRFILLFITELFIGLEGLEQEVHLIDPLIRVPVPAEPCFVFDSFLNLIEPSLCAVIYCTLVYPAKKHLRRLVFERTGMGQHDVKAFLPNLPLNICPDLIGRLLSLSLCIIKPKLCKISISPKM